MIHFFSFNRFFFSYATKIFVIGKKVSVLFQQATFAEDQETNVFFQPNQRPPAD
jgi:hypothetical protein